MSEKFGRALVSLRGAVFLGIIFLPPLLFGGSARTSLFLTQSLILSGALLWVVQRIFFEESGLWPKALNKPLLLFSFFVAYVLIQWAGRNLVFSKFLPGSIAVFKTRDYLVQLVCYVLFFVSSIDLLASRRRIQMLTLLLGFQVFILVAIGNYQQFSHPQKLTQLYGVFDLSQYGAFFSSFVNPNHYGGYLMLTTLLFVAAISYYLASLTLFRLDTDFVQAAFYFLLILLSGFSILHAEARAALFVQIWAVLIFCWAGFYVKKGTSLALILASLALLAGSVIFLSVTQFELKHLLPQTLLRDFLERLGIYRDAVKIVRDFPLFGTGLGTAMYAISSYQVTAVEEYAWIHLYSHFLELLSESGIVGFLLFVVPLSLLAAGSLRDCLKHPSRWRRFHGLASFTAIAATAVLSVMDDYLITPALAILFLVHLMILTLCGDRALLALDETKNIPTITLTPRGPAALSLKGPNGFILALVTVIFFVAWKDARAIDIMDTTGGDIRQFEKAIRLRPDDPKIWIKIGDHYFDEALALKGERFKKTAGKSVAAYDKAVSLTPMYGYYWMLAGRARILTRDRLGGLRYIARSAELVPHNRDYYLYFIVNALMLADETPWPEEKRLIEDQALSFVKKTFGLKRPLTETDHGYIRNYGEDCYGAISEPLRQRLIALIGQARA